MLKKYGKILVNAYENTPDNVECFVTTKHSGYSTGFFSSFNLGMNTQEDTRIAVKNIELLKVSCSLPVVVNLNQVHGNRVFEVDASNYHDVMFSEGDGLFTLEKDMALGIMTADCYNVFLAGRKGVCALHCGHKSVSSDIMSEGIKLFKKYDDFPVFAGIGPGISGENYQIGAELADVFRPICPQAVTENENGIYLCLRTVIEQNLRNAGIENIEHIRNCTLADDDLYSHRRDRGVTGRMMGVIVRRSDVF
ncbi:MAG: polyphenol oxidase family protein [Deferribacterales bacterium]